MFCLGSIVVTGLKKIDGFVVDTVDQPVFLGNTPRPTACEHIPERLGLAGTLERIAHNCLNQIEHSNCDVPVGFNPISQVLSEFGMEDDSSLTFPSHRASLAASQLQLRASFSLARLDAGPPATVARFVATGAGERSR